MVLTWILVAGLLALGIRAGYFFRLLESYESFLDSVERRDENYWLAWIVDGGTLVGFVCVAIYLLGFRLAPHIAAIRYTAVFIAWVFFGLLERFQIHRARKMSDFEFSVAGRTNLTLALLTGLGMTGVYAIYDWLWG